MGWRRGGWRNPRRNIEQDRTAALKGQSKAMGEIPRGVEEKGALARGGGRLQERGFPEEWGIDQDHIIGAGGGRDHFAGGGWTHRR